MQLTDRQRTSIRDVDARLSRLACDIVIGAAPDGLRAGFAEVAVHLRALEIPALTALAADIDRHAAAIAADGLAAYHQVVGDAWAAWGEAVGLAADEEPGHAATAAPPPAAERGPRLTLAADNDAPAVAWPAPAPSAPAAVVPPRLHLASAEPIVREAAPAAAAMPAPAAGDHAPAADDDQDLVVLATDPELTSMFVAEALDHLGTIEATVLRARSVAAGQAAARRRVPPVPHHQGQRRRPRAWCRCRSSRIASRTCSTSRGRASTAWAPRISTIVLQAVDVLTTMIGELPARIAGQRGTDTRAVRARLMARVDRAVAGGGTAAPAASDAPEIEAPDVASDEPAVETRRRTEGGAQSVKVDTGKLDSLIDMVGELVIAQALIYEDPASSAIVDERLQRNLAQVRRITTDLQRDAMSMRLVPIKPTFQKMARLVRDLSKKSGKVVDLVLAGEDTELDRKVVEDINDPLMHMVRNSRRPRHRVGRGAAHGGQAARGPPVAQRVAPGRQHRDRDRGRRRRPQHREDPAQGRRARPGRARRHALAERDPSPDLQAGLLDRRRGHRDLGARRRHGRGPPQHRGAARPDRHPVRPPAKARPS